MKTKYLIICFCLLSAGMSYAQNKLFDKYAEMENITSVYISKAMFEMMPKIETEGLNLMNMIGKIESLQVISSQQQDQIPQMRKDFTKLVDSKHQELMRVRNGKTRATFYANMKGDQIKDLLMLAEADTSFTVIQLLGNFSLKDVQEITKNMEK